MVSNQYSSNLCFFNYFIFYFFLNTASSLMAQGQLRAEGDSIPVVSYFTGKSNINTSPIGGICMMGGRKENDNAMRWFLRRAQGGDVLIMRASGADGYNTYLYKKLGVRVNSVETLVFKGATTHQSIIDKIDNAEAIWFAGGNQGNYIKYWKDNEIELALQRAINRNVVIGGTSAGMAILGEYVWTGERIVTQFLNIPILSGIITDTHFSERDRMGRHKNFIKEVNGKGIAADENTAICIVDGMAYVYGHASHDDNAFFIDNDMSVIVVKGLPNGSLPFNLRKW